MSIAYDAVIMGSGINGVAIARALAIEGKRVCVIDKSTIGVGASSNSSRLIHGGLRYLEHFEFSLVKEALRDQRYLLKNYPDLVERHPFYLPHYESSSRPAWMIKMGLFLYRFFSFHDKRPETVSIAQYIKNFSAMKSDTLQGVYGYFDAMTQDLKLTQTIATEAIEAGALIKEHCKINNITFKDEAIELTLDDETLHTSLLINATGAWIDEVNTKFRMPSRYSIEKLSGVHLVLEGLLTPEPLIMETQSKRIIFVLPQAHENKTLIGTTEHTEIGQTDNVMVNEGDVSYLLREINIYLNKKLERDDVLSTFVGVRPIIKTRRDPSKMSREYKLDLHKIKNHRLLHIYGGKLTTFHSLSKKVVQLLKD
jgi:glycerol-3-phosphate dehydrogenase